MSDLDKLRALLDSFGVGYKVERDGGFIDMGAWE